MSQVAAENGVVQGYNSIGRLIIIVIRLPKCKVTGRFKNMFWSDMNRPENY